MTSGTKTRKVQLTGEAILQGLDPAVLAAVESFEPLPFSAGEEAARWLRKQIEEPSEMPWRIILELSDDGTVLLGFLVLGYAKFTLSWGDRAVAEFGKKEKKPDLAPVAVELAWIARSASTEKGFGRELFTYAVSLAIDAGAIAIIVVPHDEQTAKKVWIKRYRFREPRETDQSPEAPLRLWYPVHRVEGGSWPS